MLKRIFFLVMAVAVLLTVCVLPAAAAVVTPDNVNTILPGVMLDLYFDSLVAGQAFNVDYSAGGFTSDPNINYPSSGGVNLYDPGGYVVWAMVPTSEYYENTLFGCLFGAEGLSYYPSYYLESTIEILDWTIVYKSFTANQYHSIFTYGAFPSVFNIYTESSRIGEFTSVDWGFASASVWSNLINSVQALKSYENGISEGSNLTSSPFDNATVYLSYYHLGSWHSVIPLNLSANLSDYLSSGLIDLSLLTGFNFRFSDIPAGATQVTLSLKLPIDLYAPAYKFSAYNSSNLIQSAPAFPYGVFFSDQLNSSSGIISPSDSLINGSTVTYDYYFPVTNDNNYTYFNVALDPTVVRSLTSSSVINDYVSYQIVDYNTLVNQFYDQGYSNGYSNGDEAGRSEGYQNGYLQGKNDGISAAETGNFKSLFSALIDAPVGVFTNLLSFEIFDFNLFNLVMSILSLVVIYKIVKVVI